MSNRRWLSLMICCVMAMTAVLTGASAASTVSVKVNGECLYDEARSMLSLINEFRTGEDAWYVSKDNQTKVAAGNLKELSYDFDLEKVAMQRAAEIAVYFNHERPDGSSWKSIYPTGKISRGENIGYGNSADVEGIFDAFCETDQGYSGQGHRRNMLRGEFTRVGFGAFRSGDQVYWVQAFASGKAGGSESTQSGDITVETSWGILGAAGLYDVHASVDEITVAEGASVAVPDIQAYSHTGASITISNQNWQAKDDVVGIDGEQLVGNAQGDTTLVSSFNNIELEIPVKVASSEQVDHSEAAAPAAQPVQERAMAEGELLSEAIPVEVDAEEFVDYETPLGGLRVFTLFLAPGDECFDPGE